MKKAAFISIIFMTVMTLGACGGGGSSSPETTTATPPSVLPPPLSFDAEVSFQPVLEGNIFLVEVSDSVAGNVEISQISGPVAVELDNSNTFINTFLAPELDDDIVETMVFEVTGTSGERSNTVTINVDVRGFSGPGKPVAIFDIGIELLAGDVGVPAAIGGGLNGSLSGVVGSIPQVPGLDSSPKSFVFFGSNENNGFTSYRAQDSITSLELFTESSFFEVGTLSFNLQENSGSGSNFVLLDEVEDQFRYFTESGSTPPFIFTEAEAFTINNPCYVAQRTNTAQDFIWVGQRNDGLSLVRLLPLGDGQFDTSILDQVGDGRSLCHIVTTRFSDRISPVFSNDDSELSDIITVDYDTNELVLFGDIGEDGQYDELEVVPIETQSSNELSIVDVFSRGTESQVPNYLVILLADYQNNADNRLVLVAQNAEDREIVQTVFELGEGIPVALNDGPYIGNPAGNQFERDIVVVTENSGATIFEYVDDPSNTATPPSYRQAFKFDTGVGAKSAVTASISNTLDRTENPFVLLVAYPDIGVVRQFEPVKENSN